MNKDQEGNPTVSVLMKVYNGQEHLKEAIDSVLAQTFTDFELLVIDDGSKDQSAEIVQSYEDKRIRFLQNEKNLGLCATQNKVIDAARGKYLAVMDCDDISYPQRLEKQVAYLEEHPEVIMCGTFRHDLIDGKKYPFIEPEVLSNATLQFSLVFGNYYFTHSSIMFRSREFKENRLSYGPATIAEDYQIIIEMAKRYPIAILPERLVAYRIYPQSVSKVRQEEITSAAMNIRADYVNTLDLSREDKEILVDYFRTGIAKETLEHFERAVQNVANLMGADISAQGNAAKLAESIYREYLLRVPQYRLREWKTWRKSQVHSVITLRSIFGWKIFFMCLLGYVRK